MPHGWAMAEFFLLLRDSLVFEDGQKLVLFAGIPESSFKDPRGMKLQNLPTHFGKFSCDYIFRENRGELKLSGVTAGEGFALRLPAALLVKVTVEGKEITRDERGDYLVPRDSGNVILDF